MSALAGTGVIGVLLSRGSAEWKSSPHLEGDARRVGSGLNQRIHFEVRVSNRRDEPLLIEGYWTFLRFRSGNLLLDPMRSFRRKPEMETTDLTRHRVRLDPFLPGMTKWPETTFDADIDSGATLTNTVVIVVVARHRRLWRQRSTLLIEIPISRI